MPLKGYKPTPEHRMAVSAARLGFVRPTDAQIIAFIDSGNSQSEAARWSGLSAQRVSLIAQAHGRTTNGRGRRPAAPWPEARINEMLDLVGQGLSLLYISRELGVSKGAVVRQLGRLRDEKKREAA